MFSSLCFAFFFGDGGGGISLSFSMGISCVLDIDCFFLIVEYTAHLCEKSSNFLKPVAWSSKESNWPILQAGLGYYITVNIQLMPNYEAGKIKDICGNNQFQCRCFPYLVGVFAIQRGVSMRFGQSCAFKEICGQKKWQAECLYQIWNEWNRTIFWKKNCRLRCCQTWSNLSREKCNLLVLHFSGIKGHNSCQQNVSHEIAVSEKSKMCIHETFRH